MEDVLKLIATYGVSMVITAMVLIFGAKYFIEKLKISDEQTKNYRDELIKRNNDVIAELNITIKGLANLINETKNAQEEQNRIMNNLQNTLIEHDRLSQKIFTQVKINSRDFVKDIREVNATLHVIIKQLFNKAQIQEIEREVEKETKKIEQKEKTYETVD